MENDVKNNFKELEEFKLKKYGNAPDNIQDNIEQNMNFFKTIASTVELFTEKLIKTFVKMNG